MTQIVLRLVGWTLVSILCATTLQAQITTHTALPVGSGEAIVRVQTRILRSSRSFAGESRKLTVVSVPVVGVYGITGRSTVFAIVPWLDRELKTVSDGAAISRTTSGIGDTRVFIRHSIFQHNRHGVVARLAPLVGVEVPTGSSRKSDLGGRLPAPLQPGSGSWDPFIGIVFTRLTFQNQIDLSLSYKMNSIANQFEFGDVFRLDAAAKLRVLPRKLGSGIPSFVYVNLETSVVNIGKNRIASESDNNSGGFTWHIAPGAQYVAKRYIIEVAVQVPVIQEPHGTQITNDFVVIVSGRINI